LADGFDNTASATQTSGATTNIFGASIVHESALSSYIATTRNAESATFNLIPAGSYDIYVADANGGEFRNTVSVTLNNYTITPRSGQNHIKSLWFYAAGSLTTAQKNAIIAGGSPGSAGSSGVVSFTEFKLENSTTFSGYVPPAVTANTINSAAVAGQHDIIDLSGANQ
jgi:hypothetical protein